MRKLWIHRKAVSTMVGGIIVLSLFLTALISMVFVSQQYDQYQTQVNKMSQFDNQRLSENLEFNSPGLTVVTSTFPGWGSGCGGSTYTYSCYSLTVNNAGGVGVRIVRIYINSTSSGCTTLCVLNPTLTIASYAFNQASQFINPGETNHTVALALPKTVILPNPNPPLAMNTIGIVTSLGNVFSFQWPFQLQVVGQSQSAFSLGIMKVAYQCSSYSSGVCSSTNGFDSKNEAGPVRAGSLGTVGTGYCHNESVAPYPAPPNYAEKLTGITSGLVSGGGTTLWFVDPWITVGPDSGFPNNKAIMDSADAGHTVVYIYVIVINGGNIAYTPNAGTIDLTWYGSNHIDGYLIGVYYNGAFYPPSSAPSIPPGMGYYAIFRNSIFTIGNNPTSSVMFWGTAAITNVGSTGIGAENENFYAGAILSSGLWMRYEASSGSCA